MTDTRKEDAGRGYAKWMAQRQYVVSLGVDSALREAYTSGYLRALSKRKRVEGHAYPHHCQDGHPRIGYSHVEQEVCPVCFVRAENEGLRERLTEAYGVIDELVALLKDIQDRVYIPEPSCTDRAQKFLTENKP